MELEKTEIYEEHVKLGAKMVDFAGFLMPIQYSSIKDEVAAVREHVGIFDVSHMGEFFVRGKEAIQFVDFLITNDFQSAPIGKAVYSPMCNDNGTIIDDLICYKLDDHEVLICVNASNIKKDWDWINAKAGSFNISIEDESQNFSLFALQGPEAEKILKKLDLFNVKDLPYYAVLKTKLDHLDVIVARTGYTGEDGVELFIQNESALMLWNWFMNADVTPCGLGARDVLRLEVGFPLYGHELSENLTPFECGLKWAVKMTKKDFVGKHALERTTPKMKNIKLSLEKVIPRAGYPIINSEGLTVGEVTSGTLSPTLNKGIAFASIASDVDLSKDLFVEIRNKNYKCEIHNKPFYTGGHK